MSLPLLLLLLSWSSERQDTALDLPEWQPVSQERLPDQLLAAHHPGLGADLVLRGLPTPDPALLEMALLDPAERVAALSPERLARSMERQQTDLSTHFLGPSELGTRLGRWVYQDGETLVWQVLWRTVAGEWYQVVAQAPVVDAAPFSTLMRQVEDRITVTSQVGPSLLVKKIKHQCPADLHLTRAQVLSSSQSFELAREVLEERASSPKSTALSELRMMGLLYRVSEGCLREVMESFPGCVVWESAAQSAQDHLLAAQVRDCVDGSPEMEQSLQGLVLR